MTYSMSLQQQRKILTITYDYIINQKDLPDLQFNELIRLWILENEILEAKESKLEHLFIEQKTTNNFAQIAM